MAMKVETYTVGPFQENCYLVIDEDAGRCVLIDPGDEGERLVREVRDSGAALEAIWLTHSHLDHVGAVAAVKRAWDVPVHLHPADRVLYDGAAQSARMFGVTIEQPPPPEAALAEGQKLRLGAFTFEVLLTPGHAPGHVVLHGHGIAFVGDCLFAGSVGRTDLPFSDPPALARSLERIVALGDATIAYPGHGPATTIGRERVVNPFLNGTARISAQW